MNRRPRQHRGVLCIRFVKSEQGHGDAQDLEATEEWVIAAAKLADINLQPVRGHYDSERPVIEQIYKALERADIVVAVPSRGNANVLFEAGYAQGLSKPILYVVKDGEPVPFDIGATEHFTYRDVQVGTPNGKEQLALAMGACLVTNEPRAQLVRRFATVQRHLLALKPATRFFVKLMEHALEDEARWITSWGSSYLEVAGSQNIAEMGKFIVETLESWGFATAYYSGDDDAWRVVEGGEEYFAATRAAVRRGRKISRTYVVDERTQLDIPAFRERAWADAAAGIEICYILKDDLPAPDARDFGLWDGELVGEVSYVQNARGATARLDRCTYRADAWHLRRAARWQRAIQDLARPCPDLPSEPQLLKESCGAHDIFCSENIYGKRDCTNYHRPWQVLRQADLVSTPRWHADFYSDAFRKWTVWAREHADDRELNILITGLADYGMLYWAAQSVPHRLRERCKFHVLDICRTPIESCVWLRQRLRDCNPSLKLEVQGHHRDVFDSGIDDDFADLIVSDAFLTRFETEDEKCALMTAWLRVLRADGRIVTTARVRQHTADITQTDRERFVERAQEAARERGLPVRVVEAAARDYAGYIASYPFATDDELDRFLKRTVDGPYSSSFELKVLPDHEMAPARYAHIEVVGAPS